MNDIFFEIIFPILLAIGMILWIYCIWFLNKYDKNTNRLIMLLILNFYYVPFYLFRIRKIKKEQRIKAISEDVIDTEFIEMTRTSILDTLRLWSDTKEQKRIHDLEAEVNVTNELFERWESVYRIDDKVLNETFNGSEKELLNTFDKTFLTCQKKMKEGVSDFNEFKNTNDWKVLNQLANEILKEIE